CAVPHPECRIARRNFLQPLRNIHPTITGSILGSDDSILPALVVTVAVITIAIMVPVSVTPVVAITVAPITPAPACEQCTVNRAALAIFEGASAATRASRHNPQHFHPSRRWIHIKRAVTHTKPGIRRSNLSQPAGNIHPAIVGAVFSPHNSVLPRVGIIAVTAAITTTSAVTTAATPITAAPAAEHRTVYRAPFAIFKRPLPASRGSGEDSERFHGS